MKAGIFSAINEGAVFKNRLDCEGPALLNVLPVLTKGKRLKIFLQRLETAVAAGSAGEALALVARTLNEVEDEYSGVEYNADAWKDDGRMYPPGDGNRRELSGHPSLRRYRSAKHNTFIGLNGSIRIQDLEGHVLLDKAGNDGRKTHDLEA